MTSKLKTNKKLFFGAMAIVLALPLLLVAGTASAAPSPLALFTSKAQALPPAEPEVGAEVALLQSGCSGTPVISSFAVSPPRIQPGQSATLSWGLVANAEVAYLMAPGHKIGVGTPGQMTVTPDQTTTYVLQGVCGNTTSEALVTLYVDVGECQGTPRITSFTAEPMTIQPGQTSTLSWGLVENAEAAVLIGPEGKKGVGTPGQQVVEPGQTTTYTLLGFCGRNVVAQSVTVTVQGDPGCQGTPNIEYFFANPPVIQSGGSSTLQWGLVSNASAAYLETPEGIVGVSTPGQQTVKPGQTTSYSLHAICGSVNTVANATVFVQQ